MPMIRRMAALIALLSAGCNIPGDPVLRLGDEAPPRLVGSEPAEGATGVSPEPTIALQFDGPLDERTLRGGIRLVQAAGGAPCESGTVISTCVYRPNAQDLAGGVYVVRLVPGIEGEAADGSATCERTTLARGAVHAVCLSTSLTDAAGNPLEAPEVVTFTTQQ